MSEKLPDNTNRGNDLDNELERINVRRVASDPVSEGSDDLQRPESSDEEFMPLERVEIKTIEVDDVSLELEDPATELNSREETIVDSTDNEASLSSQLADVESLDESMEEATMEFLEPDELLTEEVLGDTSEVDEGDSAILGVGIVEDDEFEDEIEELQDEIEDLQDDVEELETEVEELEDEVEDLQDDVEELEGESVEIEDDEDSIAEDAVLAVAKYATARTPRPRVAAGLRNVLLVLLFLWMAFVFVAPFFLPQGLDTPNLDILSGDHLLGTDNLGRDVLRNVLRAGQTSLIYSLIPTAIALFGMVMTYRSWSEPSSRKSRSFLMRPMPFTVIALIAAFALGLYLPRTWVYFIIVAFLSLVLWLREAFAFAHYVKAYRQARPNQYSYYLGARELDNIRLTYGQEVRAAFLCSVLNVFVRAYLIISVLPFADNSITVPLGSDWASQVLLRLQQGVSLLDLEVLPHFIGWTITLVLVVLILALNLRVAKRQTVLTSMRMRTNLWRAGDED